ncbi:gem-associated protein 5 [Cottoperca gobio]|uniref:Gem-associated protein 5 n=1 Tax=Cottoperca gobio TaxID=56716 RepID=A0A6J2QZX9_COTGO|nr:gem-associated protein 5 [Cottoperca gobio]XP_029304089.1 gem-associated protein 5 [Cottoperca gobio]XP_029304090.1 gem-associated protein 5 [Cottoperca gobio]XP_029304091.1 gem-associated protein 5 [Cottoperca gobio]
MHERSLPASPNWYCSRCSDVNSSALLGVGAKNIIYLIDVSASSCRVVGELVGHKDLVSGFSFCQHAGQSHICVSSSNDGSIRFWDSDNKVLIREHAAHQSPVAAVHWSPVDKNLVVSGDEKGIVVCHWYNTGDTASFFPEPRTIFCLTCSPHTWSSVAVGYKDGMIVLIDVSKKGEVMHRLRGHEDEIHSLAWSPLTGEDTFSRPEDSEAISGVSAGDEKGCYLASGSKDQTMRIWSSSKGKSVTTLKLPYLKKRGSAVDPGVKERLWLHVHWPKGRPTQLVSSCFGGELVMWDLTRTGKQRWTLFGTSSEGQNHNRIVFNVSSVHLQDDRELLISTSMDREIKCWDLASLDCCWTLPTLGGFIYALTFSPVGAGCLALGVGDNMIRVWNTLTTQNQYDTRSFWQGIKSKVTALAWHPKKEGSLSFGTDDGKVGIYEVFSNRPPQISSSYHRKTVYTLAWGPPVPPMSFGAAGGKPLYSLYSCAGEGVILQHDPSKLSGEASDIDKLIRDTNNIKHKLSPHTDLSWKPDGKVVAIGNEDGCIDVYEAPSLKLLCSIQQHHKIINTLRWHHAHSSPPELHCLLASGSSNATVYVHDLHAIIEDPPDVPVVLTEPYRRLCGHTSKITGMVWSPHHEARLATVSYDGTAQVWDVLQEAAVSNYRGHAGYLLCVDWSPVDPDVIWTGGKDFTLQEWRVSKQEFTKPPKGKKMVNLRDKKKKNKKASGPAGAAPLEMNGEPGTGGGEKAATGQEQSGDDEEDEVNPTKSPVPPSATFETQRKSFTAAKSKDKPDLLKKKKPRSMLPISTSMDHRPKEELLQDCLTLASVKHSRAPPAGCVPGQGEHIHLGLFSDRAALYRMFEAEEEGHVEAGHYDSVVYLRLWSGDLEGALQLATEKGELNEHLLSVAPMAGFEVWSRTVEAFVKQLCLQEQYLKAASHLLSINKLYEAVDLLRSHKLYREAIALVKARLPAEEPALKELYTCWAAVLERDGHFSAAAKCYLAAGASFDAAKVIARKNDVSSLSTAAGLARISGEVALAQSLALRCAKDLAGAQDWIGAQEVLSSQESLLVHRLHLCVAELLAGMLAEPQAASQPRVASHPWASPGEHRRSIRDQVRDAWEKQFGVTQRSAGHRSAAALLQELKSVESPTPTANIPLRQVQLYSSLHLTRAVLGWLLDDDGQLMKELWQAVAWLREAGHFCVSAELCRLLFPDGVVSVCSRSHPKVIHHTEEEAKAAANSLQAFVCYHRLYQQWWRISTQMQSGLSLSAADSDPGDEVNDKVVNGGVSESGQSVCPATRRFDNLDFDASVLLSERHAACQASQRSVREIQERLAALVLRHSRAQGGQLESGEKEADSTAQTSDTREASDDAGQRPEDQETLLSLSTKMSEHQKQLADLPDTIKVYPHPDVVECCLVLLHLSKSSPSVSESLQQEAKDLLRTYGTNPSILKTCQKFLT